MDVAAIEARLQLPEYQNLSGRELARRLGVPESSLRTLRGKMSGRVELMRLSEIRIDGGTQLRVELDQETVGEYAEKMAAGEQFPPLIGYRDGVNVWLAGGFHRFFAAQQAGLKDVAVEVRVGTQRDAVLFAAGDNAKHGLRRSNADKRKAVLMLLKDEEWGRRADNWIATTANVSPTLVARVRAELEIPKPAVVVTERNGKPVEMKTGKIGKTTGKPFTVADDGDIEVHYSGQMPESLRNPNPPDPDRAVVPIPLGASLGGKITVEESTPGGGWPTLGQHMVAGIKRFAESLEGKSDEGVATSLVEPDPEAEKQEWLEQCSEVWERLGPGPRMLYQREALKYRELKASADWQAFERLARKLFNPREIEGKRGPYHGIVMRLIDASHPKYWMVCGKCDGAGMTPGEHGSQFECSACRGAGYEVTRGQR